MNITSSTNEKPYKCLSFISILYVITLLLTIVIENRIVIIGSIKILSGTLVLPLSYAISDIITEVYGYKHMRRLIWISIASLYISAFIIYIIMSLPTDQSNMMSTSYSLIFSKLPKDVFTYSIAALLSTFLNVYILSKWKILTRGRYFWLRSLGSMIVGEAIFILIWGFLGFSSKFQLTTLLELMLISYLYKIIYNLITIIPTSIFVAFLKKTESIDAYEHCVNFSPFSWEA